MTIGTLVAFTALQAGLFRPIIGPAQRRRLPGQLARAVRADLRVPRPARGGRRPRATPSTSTPPGSAATCGSRTSPSPTRAATSPRSPGSRSTSPPGTTLALVGETGSGKSTLAALITRLHDPDAGRITIDGIDLRDLRLADLARIVGVVSQETYLLHASVRENLRHVRPDATDAEIEAAARAAQIHDLIESLPGGLRHPRRLARPPLLRRRAPAHRHRPHAAARPAGAGARRGHQRPGHRDRAGRPARLRRAGPGPDHDHHRPPALDGPRRRPDRGAGPRPDRRVRHARRAGGRATAATPPSPRDRTSDRGVALRCGAEIVR